MKELTTLLRRLSDQKLLKITYVQRENLTVKRLFFEHFPLALISGLLGFAWSHEWQCIPAALVAGWMLDADHIFDFARYVICNRPNIDMSLIRNGGYFKVNNKVLVPLHAWELTVAMAIFGAVLDSPPLITAAIAHGAHLIQDQGAYKVRPLGYWFISRTMSRFSLNGFCKK